MSKERIQQSMRESMKSGDRQRTSVLRMLMADINYAELAGQQMEDAIVGYARKLERSIREYLDLGKSDEADRLRQEHEIVSEFAPKRLNEQETEAVVDSVIAELNLSGPQDFGKGMKRVMADHGQQVDGNMVQAMLKRKLNEKAGEK